MATHSSILAWRIPWTEDPDGLYCSWGHKVLDMTEHSCMHRHDRDLLTNLCRLYVLIFLSKWIHSTLHEHIFFACAFLQVFFQSHTPRTWESWPFVLHLEFKIAFYFPSIWNHCQIQGQYRKPKCMTVADRGCSVRVPFPSPLWLQLGPWLEILPRDWEVVEKQVCSFKLPLFPSTWIGELWHSKAVILKLDYTSESTGRLLKHRLHPILRVLIQQIWSGSESLKVLQAPNVAGAASLRTVHWKPLCYSNALVKYWLHCILLWGSF